MLTEVVTADGIRASTPEDGPAITSLLSESGLDVDPDPRHQHWKYWQPRADWPGPRSYVMVSGGRIVAHGGIVPGTLLANTRRLRIIHVIDWAARPNALGAGVSLMKYVGHMADALLAIGGSDQTLRLLPHLGYRPHGVATGYVRTLRPLRILRRGAKPTWKLLPRLARNMIWAWSAPAARIPGWEARRIEAGQIDSLAGVMPVATGDTAVLERSSDALRHALECPIASMELYSVLHAGTLRGYFLLTRVPGQTRLADCWLDSGQPSDWRALLGCAVAKAARHADAAEIVAWASEPILMRALLESGFHMRNTQSIQLRGRGGITHSIGGVRAQMLDNDAAYLHDGQPQSWA